MALQIKDDPSRRLGRLLGAYIDNIARHEYVQRFYQHKKAYRKY